MSAPAKRHRERENSVGVKSIGIYLELVSNNSFNENGLGEAEVLEQLQA